MPATSILNKASMHGCRHRSASAINGYEDNSANSSFLMPNETTKDPAGNSNGWNAKLSKSQLHDYVQSLNATCSKCGLTWQFPSTQSNEATAEMVNGGASNSHNETATLASGSNGLPHESTNNANIAELITNRTNGVINNNSKIGCPFAGGKKELKNIRLKNYVQASEKIDQLHLKAEATHCSANRCMGSLMQPYGGTEHASRPYGVPRHPEEGISNNISNIAYLKATLELKVDKRVKTDQNFLCIRNGSNAHKERLATIFKEINATGQYELTFDELQFGAKQAWRNAPRCIGRIQWNNLKLFDARKAVTAKDMFDALMEHLEYATNGGNLRSTITIFRERKAGAKDIRLWNSQLIKYAGYKQEDGSIVGDPSGVEFTKICERLGWKGPGGRFDVLPLVLEPVEGPVEYFDIPEELALQVDIKHPEYPWFEELSLKWYALPAVANMQLDVGGIEFTVAPFNGWYMVTEVGARDLGDTARYNMLEPIAKKMNLNTKTNASLWKDKAVTELNYAVLHSFTEAKVTMTDHHTASETFIKHMENEQRSRGGCPADWVWIVPPSSGSTTEVFHQEMLNYVLKPSYDYQPDAWRHYKFGDANENKLTFKQAALLVKVCNVLKKMVMAKRSKATIIYATETGKSEKFAKMLQQLFSQAFDVKVFCMDEYDFSRLSHETLLFVVASTFGNGEAPMNGEKFGDDLHKLQHPEDSDEKEATVSSEAAGKLLEGLKFAVFGLGSTAYPSFCAFAHSCRDLLIELGGTEINSIGEGDELRGQEDSFKHWAEATFKAACDVYSIDESKLEKKHGLDSQRLTYEPNKCRFQYEEPGLSFDLHKGLSEVHRKKVGNAKVISVEELQTSESNRSTVLVRLSRAALKEELKYEPGDHLSIFPCNEAAIVEKLIGQLKNAPNPDDQIQIEVGKDGRWENFKRLPRGCTLRTALTRFIDITTSPSQEMLTTFAKLASDEKDQKKLKALAEDVEVYEGWKYQKSPNIAEVIDEFPSLQLNGIDLLTQLPNLQCRYYSISSSPLMYPDEIHATVAVVSYETIAEPRKVRRGVCSYWLSGLKPGDDVPCYVRQAANFHMPKDNSLPIIMIGPGTGIAPLRSFWQQRQRLRQDAKYADWGSMDLYFGCRNINQDDIYAAERERACVDRALTNVFRALSREPGVQKTYVQHLIKRNSKNVYDTLFNNNGHIFVCGDVGMASDVGATLCDIVQQHSQCSKEHAQATVKKLKTSAHYHEDIFGVGVIKIAAQRTRSFLPNE
eukprot:gene14272-15759_t